MYTFLTICYSVQNICSDVCLINVPSINLHLSGSSLVLTLHCIFHHIIIYYYNNNLHLPGSSLVLTLHCIFQPHNILYNYISTRAGKFLYRYQECIDPGPESNILMDHFLCFLHFDPVLLNFL